ncbi:phosphatidylserine decarboxylase 1 [Tieghemiomyces parasiticus]|uniref:Phosphatidylserine decarboxylase proenzyme 1, mitochondrial n=1 Tax=Tieghemiomyces parasiticus TaxID=78921 RepID=A0A9W8DZW6_9FUNG|nr:phosphatidylserine decarboxylase 1 [Tieghemiomyces parasiticus]
MLSHYTRLPRLVTTLPGLTPSPASIRTPRLATLRGHAVSGRNGQRAPRPFVWANTRSYVISNRNPPPSHKEKARGEGQTSPDARWYAISATAGLAFLAVFQMMRNLRDHKAAEEAKASGANPARPQRVVPEGPWQVHIMTALPLKAVSRFFGAFNDLTIPVWLRAPGFRLYSWIFGCNLDEMREPDLRKYPNLGEFFYRELKSDARPIVDPNASLVSPADGRVLNFGVIRGRVVESVKGLTYNLDAFLGSSDDESADGAVQKRQAQELAQVTRSNKITNDEEFANVNGVSYSLGDLIEGGSVNAKDAQSTPAVVAPRGYGRGLREGHELFFSVIYLAPGDYHRFHSPAHWVVERRKHFAGELYSVSPYVLSMIRDLFVLNERVALLGRWRYGFMSMIPVGATNVGSIKINFDPVLRTNANENLPTGMFTEVTYSKASPLLRGVPLTAGEEIGGFRLGSTIVLVFEAPKNFRFTIEPEQRVKVGEPLGYVQEPPIV